MGALSHLRVLDLSRVLAGPWASQVLADLGADVVKVERPGTGDDTRGWGPPFLDDPHGNPTRESAYFLSTNRNKRSITVDFTQPRGQEIVRALAAQSDVLIENFKVDGLAQFGLDYASIAAINPSLIYCSITGFGQTGPYRLRPGYDLLIQAMGGLMSITGRADGEEGAGPQKVGVAVVDILTGLYAATAVLAALSARERGAPGQHVDLALLDVEIACLANQAMNHLVSGQAPIRLGNAHPNVVPYQDFPTSDGNMILAVGNDAQFASFCDVAGRAEWALDPRFATNSARVRHRGELIPQLRRCTIERSTGQWVEVLERAGVPCGPVNDIDAVFRDPQVIARRLRIELPHACGSQVPLVDSPIRLSATPITHRCGPPMLGADTAEVLAERLGLGSPQIAELRAGGVI